MLIRAEMKDSLYSISFHHSDFDNLVEIIEVVFFLKCYQLIRDTLLIWLDRRQDLYSNLETFALSLLIFTAQLKGKDFVKPFITLVIIFFLMFPSLITLPLWWH